MAGLAWFLALVLASSAIQKLLERNRTSTATAKLARIGPGIALPLSLVLAAAETMAGMALLFPATQALGAVLAMGLWLAYGAALVAASRRGDTLDCGCSFAVRHKPIDTFTIGRAFVLAGLAGITLLAAAAGATPPGIEPLFAAFGLFTLYHAAGEIAALPAPHGKAAR